MSLAGVLQKMDDERKDKLINELSQPQFQDSDAIQMDPASKYKLMIKRKGMAGILSKMLHKDDEEKLFEHFKIGRGQHNK